MDISNQNAPYVPQIYDFDGYSIYKRKDGIVQVHFVDGIEIGIDTVREVVQEIKKIKGEGKCQLVVLFEDENTFTNETREFMASDEVSEILSASALVTKGLALEILVNGYIRINKPPRPVRIFKSPVTAVEWLHKLRE